MIIQTGMRTDIPAFYSKWFANRLREGYVLVRNPYNPTSITRYDLNPDVVDLIGFCSKNPEPMLKYMDLLSPYAQFWFVTITPYGDDIEPHVPPYDAVIETFHRLSETVGKNCISWRYDPIIIDDQRTMQAHVDAFSHIAKALAGYTDTCVISFIDLYSKVRRNYPEVRPIPEAIQMELTRSFVQIAAEYGITIKPCGESRRLEEVGADCSGCMTLATFERAIGAHLDAPANPNNRKECSCYLTGDIGEYNTCGHLCRYCYANADKDIVRRNMAQHDPDSPLLIGHLEPSDVVHQANQRSWIDRQMRIEDFSTISPK